MNNFPNTIDERQLIDWLLEGDVSIQYQVYRDLLADEKPHLRGRIATEGWGAQFLSFRKKEGHWGQHFYQPKWISTHYTILDLKNLAISPNSGCNEGAMSAAEVIDTCEPKNAVAAVDNIAIEIKPPSGIEINKSFLA